MDAATKNIAAGAVLASRNCIRALMNDSDSDLGQPQNADDAWDYTPNVDVTELTARAEPMLRAPLADTPHLWGSDENGGQGEGEPREAGQDGEVGCSGCAKGSGGDWGQQPNPRFTRV